jgi:LAGLIDADG-like domain
VKRLGWRNAPLQGLMDSDGTVSPDGKAFFSSNSRPLMEDVMFLVRSLGGQASWNSTGKTGGHKAYLRLEQQMFRLPRKQIRHRPLRRWMQPILAINPIPDEPSQCIAVDNADQQFAVGEFVRTHSGTLQG